MIKIFIILKPGVEFVVGSGIQAFLGLVKKYLIHRSSHATVAITVMRAEYTEGAPDIQMEISGHGIDELVRKDIKDLFRHFPGLEHSIPQITLEVVCK